MKSLFLSFLLLLSHYVRADESRPNAQPPPTRTLGIKAPGKISSVVWSLQHSFAVVCLQLAHVSEEDARAPQSSTQVWLLKSDGQAIPQSTEPMTSGISKGGVYTPMILYAFPKSAATEAVAVVVQIDDQLWVESLTAKP